VCPAVAITTTLIQAARQQATTGFEGGVPLARVIEHQNVSVERVIDQPALKQLTWCTHLHHVASFASGERHMLVRPVTHRDVARELRVKNIARKRTAHQLRRQAWNARITFWWHVDARLAITVADVANVINACSKRYVAAVAA